MSDPVQIGERIREARQARGWTQDELAELKLLRSVTDSLGKRATLTLYEEADHAFHAPKRSGRTDAQTLQELTHALAQWLTQDRQ